MRIANPFRLIGGVAFARIDVRLAQRLLDRGGATRHIELTHQKLAAELGTAREVVSRQLNEFQQRGRIATSRGAIGVVNAEGLSKLASAP